MTTGLNRYIRRYQKKVAHRIDPPMSHDWAPLLFAVFVAGIWRVVV
jgi:hypothetical protein